MKIGQKVFVVMKTEKENLHRVDFCVISFDDTVVMVIDGLGKEKFAIHRLKRDDVFTDEAQANLLIREIRGKRENILIHNKVISSDKFSLY